MPTCSGRAGNWLPSSAPSVQSSQPACRANPLGENTDGHRQKVTEFEPNAEHPRDAAQQAHCIE
ncbi:MAG: hypothetical protein HPM95_00375 [Alphaproteobacteria bacterium]|nr:hypothetical protein [Alphaproteobacteria bacterium]